MPRLIPARQPPGQLAMRSHFLITTRRWAVSLTNYGRAGVSRTHRPSAAVSSLSSAAAPSGDVPDVPELTAWIQRNAGRVDGATLVNLGASGWGLKAAQDVQPGHRLIMLPAACHLTYGVNDDPRLLSLVDKVPSDLWGAKLALQLIYQRLRGPNSQFATYITNLPRGVPGVPMFFSKRALDLIDYPPVSQQVQKRCRWLFTFSQQVLAKLPGTPGDPFGGVTVDINAMGWALACVSSRAFRTRGPSHPAAMLPLIDMANHSFAPNAEVLPLDSGAVGLFAKTKIAAGEPLLLSYGKLSNDFLFMDYGFIVLDNPYDSVQLRFDVGLLQAGALVANVTDAVGAPLELSLAPWRLALLTELRLAGPSADTELNLGGGGSDSSALVDRRLLAAARIMVARQEGEVVGRGVERLCAIDRPLSKENEMAALRIIAGVVAVALSNFRTTLDQDLALLAGEVPTPAAAGSDAAADVMLPLANDDEFLAVRFRAEKKKILSRTLQQVADLTSALSNGEVRQTTGLASTKKGSKPVPATNKGFGKK
ncbi:hypothetical protein Vretimale_3773 [Volvox reticuliferus]|uniref:SET domain-containing protein n=1 Tax=Volvox reticuliferus TaxID=1737510 RepID=A0A8J4FH52_9CHLO|nr:hypothetical protein Vretifemale_1400 [Volvox reticuliferus]GIL98405.1 hypothetical protein Vretimale_3773 [Volvox reticuliferus]